MSEALGTGAEPLASSRTDQIERYTFRERVCHWLTGFTYLYCLCTGLAFYTPYLFWMAITLGGGATSRFWHPIVGVAFVGAATWMHGIWREDMSISAEDRAWLDKAGDYATNHDESLPPPDRFNAGQKVFYWAMFYGALTLLVSGVFMWFPEYIPFSFRWVRPIFVVVHEVAALVTIGAFIIHIYMGIFMVPGSVAAIVQGHVSRDWARAHHRRWYERVTGKPAPGE
jgi:formate dehydrogenase subunit gamma